MIQLAPLLLVCPLENGLRCHKQIWEKCTLIHSFLSCPWCCFVIQWGKCNFSLKKKKIHSDLFCVFWKINKSFWKMWSKIDMIISMHNTPKIIPTSKKSWLYFAPLLIWKSHLLQVANSASALMCGPVTVFFCGFHDLRCQDSHALLVLHREFYSKSHLIFHFFFYNSDIAIENTWNKGTSNVMCFDVSI